MGETGRTIFVYGAMMKILVLLLMRKYLMSYHDLANIQLI